MSHDGDPADQPDVFSQPPVLRTERLVLRQITEADGEGLFGIVRAEWAAGAAGAASGAGAGQPVS